MTMIRTLLAVSIFAASIGSVQAQTAPAVPGTPAAPMAPMPGGMAIGAAGAPGMGGMMGDDMGKMMQSMAPMMRMMMMGAGMDRMDGPMGMMAPERVEGRIAFLKTEIKITDAQLPQWNVYAEILRKNAKGMSEMRGMMMQAPAQTSAPDRADQHIKMMTSGLEGAKATATATRTLYAVLSDAQKKTADELLAPAMGRM